MRVIKAAKAKRTNASGEAKLAPALVLGGALAVLDPVELVVVAVLEEVPIFLLDFPTVIVSWEYAYHWWWSFQFRWMKRLRR